MNIKVGLGVWGIVLAVPAVAVPDQNVVRGEEARAIWAQLPDSSEHQDDGWRWRESATWSCKKSYDSEAARDQYECYRK